VVPEHVSVRLAGDGDIPRLAALRRAWSEEQAGHPLDDLTFDERFASWYSTEAAARVRFVAEINGAAVGMVNLAIFERMPRPGGAASRWGHLGNAFVLAAHRNRGIGGALLDALVSEARHRGCVRLVLSPSERSVSFYERAGFGPATMLLARVLGP
jgi:GNAT superfamily N-acetyltransferase